MVPKQIFSGRCSQRLAQYPACSVGIGGFFSFWGAEDFTLLLLLCYYRIEVKKALEQSMLL